MPQVNLNEIGRTGQNRWGGQIYEEYLKDLQGRKGMAVYKEMSDNDDVIGAILYATEMLIRQAPWFVQPGGSTDKDQEAAEFITSCMYDMSDTWTDTISEILSFLIYGWSAHEIVYKRRQGKNTDERLNSKYNDGLIAWRKLPIRAQETLWEWIYDDNDNLIGMAQMPPPGYEIITIPIDKLLLFRTKSRKGSPEGRSILRSAYRSWYFKRRIQEIEGIGIERDLAGFPVLTAPEGMSLWDEDNPDMTAVRAAADRIVQSIRRDSLEGLTMPSGWKLELLSTGGRRQFDTCAIIERYDTRMAMTVLADFVLLGHQKVGSFALSSDKTKLFSMAIGVYLDIICEAFNNKAIPALIEMNSEHFSGITSYPTLEHGDVEGADLTALAAYLKEVTGAGLLIPDEGIEDFVRAAAGLPERIDGEETQRTRSTVNEEDEEEVAKAKERLGRME